MKYPGGVIHKKNSIQNHENVIYGNRGMNLENDINQSNEYYRKINRALIYKKPTPIKISEVDYKGQGKVIKKAYFECPSTTDYNGIYKGYYIDFEAKETKSMTSFPLKNIHEHQLDHMFKVIEHGGICFLIVRFVRRNQTYLLLAEDLEKFLTENKRSSIPLEYFEQVGKLIPDSYLPRVNYLNIIDEIYGGVLNDQENKSRKKKI